MRILRYRYTVRIVVLVALIAAGRPCAAAHAQMQASSNELRMLVAETISARKQEAISSALETQEVVRPAAVKPAPAIAQEPPAPPAKKEIPLPATQTPAVENAPPVAKGAWTIPKGKFYCELYNKYYWHHAQFDNDGHRVAWGYHGKYNEISTDLKMEYGLADTASLLLELPFKEAHWKDDFAHYTNRGLTDWWTGIKYRLAIEPVVTSVQARVKIPGNYNKDQPPALGRKQVDYEVKLLLAKSLAPLINGYSKLETGFRYRTHLPTDEIPYFLEFGYNLTRFLILKTTLDGVQGIKGTGDIEEDYTKWTLGTIWRIKNYGIELGYGDTFMGKNTSAAQEVILSLSSLF